MRRVLAVALVGLAACRPEPAAAPPDAAPARHPATASAPRPAGDVPPYQYRSAARRSPFEPSHAGAAALADGRQRQPLERFHLAQLRMVGTLAAGGANYALVADPTGTIHRVAVGDYLGADNGRVTEIGRRAIALRETVPGDQAGPRARPRTLALATRDSRQAQDAAAVPPAAEAELASTANGGQP